MSSIKNNKRVLTTQYAGITQSFLVKKSPI
jgi:hypothetical protein